MNIEQKQSIVKKAKKLLGYEKMTIDEQALDDSGDISTMGGTIPEDDFTYYILVFEEDPANNRERILVEVFYNWDNNPICRYDDPFGIAWDDDIWRAVDDSVLHEDIFIDTEGWVQRNRETVFAYSDTNGIGWNADLMGYLGVWPSTLYGWGEVTLEAKNTGSISGSSQIHARYAHVTGLSGSIGLTFGNISVEYSGSRDADTRATFVTYDY